MDIDIQTRLDQVLRAIRKMETEKIRSLDLGITVDQAFVLSHVSRHEGCSQKECALALGKDPASMTRMLDIIEKQNFVYRKPLANNRRKFALYTTKEGENILEKIKPLRKQVIQKSIQGIQEHEIDITMRVLNLMQFNIVD